MTGAFRHKSDCAVHNEPAYPAGPCDCTPLIEAAIIDYWGERCPEYQSGCPTCEAWAEYDRMRG